MQIQSRTRSREAAVPAAPGVPVLSPLERRAPARARVWAPQHRTFVGRSASRASGRGCARGPSAEPGAERVSAHGGPTVFPGTGIEAGRRFSAPLGGTARGPRREERPPQQRPAPPGPCPLPAGQVTAAGAAPGAERSSPRRPPEIRGPRRGRVRRPSASGLFAARRPLAPSPRAAWRRETARGAGRHGSGLRGRSGRGRSAAVSERGREGARAPGPPPPRGVCVALQRRSGPRRGPAEGRGPTAPREEPRAAPAAHHGRPVGRRSGLGGGGGAARRPWRWRWRRGRSWWESGSCASAAARSRWRAGAGGPG